MLSVNKLFLFSHEHIVSRKELVYYKRFPLIFVYVFQYIFKKVDVLSFSFPLYPENHHEKIYDFGEKVYSHVLLLLLVEVSRGWNNATLCVLLQ